MLNKTDIVKERYTVSVQPYSGSNVGIGSGLNSKVIFKLFNNADYGDLSTAYLNFSTTFTATTQSELAGFSFEDCVLSWFNLCRTLVNDQVVEEISNFSQWVNLINYASMSKSYYETAGSFSGCYRHSMYLQGGPRGSITLGTAIATTTPTTALDFGTVVSNIETWAQLKDGAPSWVPAVARGSGALDVWASDQMTNRSNAAVTRFWTVPLAGYLGLFSLDKYFPLRSVASVAIELSLPTNIFGVIYNNRLPATQAAITGAKLTLNDLYLHYDAVKMSDAYYQLMDSELINPDGLGVQYTVNTVESTVVTIPRGNSKKTLVASKGTRFLKSLYVGQQPQFTRESGAMPPSSMFPLSGFTSAQLVVNSQRYPQFTIDNAARAYQELMKSVGKFNSIVGDSIITYPKYTLDLASEVTSITADQDLIYATFILGFNLEQVLDSDITLQGLNTVTAGFQLQLELTSNPQVITNAFIFPHFSKIIKIKAGSVSILN
jgi:hypothetical protein